MTRPKRVLCMMDLSGVGRAGLASVLPVLAACGVQACPLPMALLSAHTGGFGVVALEGQAAYGKAALRHYAEQGVEFDAIYSGYLMDEGQFRLVCQAHEMYPEAYKVVDPAMADHGRLYTGLPPEMPAWMGELCEGADLVTPNATEAALLLGEEPATEMTEERLAGELQAGRLPGAQALVTSVCGADKGWKVLGFDGERGFSVETPRVAQDYPGTGDLFAAAVTGLLLRGTPLADAARRGARFVRAAAQDTFAGKGEARQGVWFERHLHLLAQGGETP